MTLSVEDNVIDLGDEILITQAVYNRAHSALRESEGADGSIHHEDEQPEKRAKISVLAASSATAACLRTGKTSCAIAKPYLPDQLR